MTFRMEGSSSMIKTFRRGGTEATTISLLRANDSMMMTVISNSLTWQRAGAILCNLSANVKAFTSAIMSLFKRSAAILAAQCRLEAGAISEMRTLPPRMVHGQRQIPWAAHGAYHCLAFFSPAGSSEMAN